MINNECTFLDIIDTKYVKTWNLNIWKLKQSASARKFNEKISWITHYAKIKLCFNKHVEYILLYLYDFQKNMTWCWNINNWKNIIHELIELMKLWSLIYSTVEAIVYMIYYNTFMIMITWIQHDMNCSYQAAWCCSKTTSNSEKLCCFRTTKIFENSR